MNSSLAQTAEANVKSASRRMVDAPTRVFHGLLALCFTVAWITGDSEEWRYLHLTMGYTLMGLLGFRLLYGLVGPKQSRFSLLWRRVASLPSILRRAFPLQLPVLKQGISPTASAVVMALMVLLIPALASGLSAHFEWTGDWMEEVHEFFANTLLLLVIVHLALITLMSLQRRQNMPLTMLTGRMTGQGADVVKRNYGVVAVLMMVAVLAFWGWSWQQAPSLSDQAVTTSQAQKHVKHSHHD
jgi:cytochrome b